MEMGSVLIERGVQGGRTTSDVFVRKLVMTGDSFLFPFFFFLFPFFFLSFFSLRPWLVPEFAPLHLTFCILTPTTKGYLPRQNMYEVQCSVCG